MMLVEQVVLVLGDGGRVVARAAGDGGGGFPLEAGEGIGVRERRCQGARRLLERVDEAAVSLAAAVGCYTDVGGAAG